MNRRRLALLAFAAILATAHTAAAKACPNIMFVLDQSDSMAEDPNGVKGNHPTKFELLQQAVISVVNQYGDRVPFGLELFSADGFFGTPAADTICYMDAMISVEPAGPTEDRSVRSNLIVSTVKGAAPVASSHTNTGEAIKRAAADMALMDKARNNYLVLVTDGVPSCNSEDLMNLSMGNGATYTIAQINNARNQSPTLHTFVVGFDGSASGVDKSSLDDMAYAGGEAPKGCGNGVPCYFSASDAMAFQTAIGHLIDQITGGEFGNTLCDDSCFATPCPAGQTCEKGELDPAPHCIPDPCMGKQCGGDQFCRMGQCVSACSDGCKSGQACQDGNCVADPCASISCMDGMKCCPLGVMGCTAGQCVTDFCKDKTCSPPTVCEDGSGKCIEDQCHIITCPSGTTCQSPSGNCIAAQGSKRGKGCSIDAGSHGSDGMLSGLALSLLALLGLAFVLRRQTLV